MANKTKRLLHKTYDYISKLLNNNKVEFIVFLLFLGVSCIYLFSSRFIVSLDGPQHLYNSQVLIDLLKSNDIVSQFFKINSVIVGYWISHIILALLNWIFPAWLAEKLFILICIAGLAFAFRYFIKSFTTKTTYLFLLIIPFLNHQYLLFGYYAFSMAWIFFFLTLGYFFRSYNKSGIRQSVVLAVLLVLTFLTHMIVFAFTLFVMGSYLIYDSLRFSGYNNLKSFLKQKIPFFLRYLLIILPASVLAAIYYKHVAGIKMVAVEKIFTSKMLWEYVRDFKFLVAFDHVLESPFNRVLFFVTAVLFIYSLIVLVLEISGRKEGDKSVIRIKTFLLIISCLVFIVYFAAPDLFGTGSLKIRILVFFFFLVVSVISLTKTPGLMQFVSAIIILWYLIGIFNVRKATYLNLSRQAIDFEFIESRMEENSVYFQMRMITEWNNEHFPLYTGSDKTLVNVRNPQCLGHFPIVWNWKEIPATMMGSYSSTNMNNMWFSNHDRTHRFVKIDYIVVFGYWDFINKDIFTDLREKVFEFYSLDTISKDGMVGLLKFNMSERFDSILNKNLTDESLKDYFTVKSLQYKTSFENAVFLATAEDFRIYKDEPVSTDYYLKRIFTDKEWLTQVKEKALKKGIPLEQMAEIDAKYMYDIYLGTNEVTVKPDVDYYIKEILKDQFWREQIVKKAEEKNISFYEMVLTDARYMYRLYLKQNYKQIRTQ